MVEACRQVDEILPRLSQVLPRVIAELGEEDHTVEFAIDAVSCAELFIHLDDETDPVPARNVLVAAEAPEKKVTEDHRKLSFHMLKALTLRLKAVAMATRPESMM